MRVLPVHCGGVGLMALVQARPMFDDFSRSRDEYGVHSGRYQEPALTPGRERVGGKSSWCVGTAIHAAPGARRSVVNQDQTARAAGQQRMPRSVYDALREAGNGASASLSSFPISRPKPDRHGSLRGRRPVLSFHHALAHQRGTPAARPRTGFRASSSPARGGRGSSGLG